MAGVIRWVIAALGIGILLLLAYGIFCAFYHAPFLLIPVAVIAACAAFNHFMTTKVQNEKVKKCYSFFVSFLQISLGLLIIGSFIYSAFFNYSEEIFAFFREHKKAILCIGVVLFMAYLDR